MQKNYLFFETKLSKTKNSIFQKNNANAKISFSKIAQQRFIVFALLLVANLSFSQLTTEFFETGIPSTWAITSNLPTAPANNWIATSNGGYLASGGAIVNPSLNTTTGVTAEYFMITPQFITPSNGEIRFWTKQGSFTNKGTVYQIRISTANQPDISSFNVVLQSWTEPQLNTVATTYQEKIVPISSLPAGIPVYIAFVAVTNQTGTTATAGDSWFVDNVRVSTSCPPVTGITSVVASDSAVINWTHPTATNFGIEVVAAGAGHGATGNPISGTTYTANGLTANTTYDVYIITNCDASTSSTWAGPFQFTTSLVGISCQTPIVVPTTVPTTPFVYSGNYQDFYVTANYTPYTSVGNSCLSGTTQNYLSGDHIYFSYTPTVDGLINITQAVNTGAAPCYNDNSSAFIYDNCAGVGTSAACLGATFTGTNNTSSTIYNTYVQAGHTYTIVLSSPFGHDGPVGMCFTLTISGSSCPAPSVISYQHLTQTGASFSWNNIGNFVSNWEYVAIPAASGIPTGSEILSATATNLDNSVIGLLPNTAYNLYVRSVCDGTPGPWATPFPFTTLCTVFNTPYYTGFTPGGECWTALNLNNDLDKFTFGQSADSEPVAKLLTANAGNLTNDMLVSPQIHLDGVTQKRLRFKYNIYGNWGSAANPTAGPGSFEVKLSTTGVGEQDFTTTIVPLASYTTAYDVIEMIVPIPNITGNINIAWYLPSGANQTGNWIYIDDVYVEDLPACSEPSYPTITAGSITNSSAQVSWTNGYNNSQWQIVAQPLGTGTPTTSGILVTTNPYTLTNLMPSTRYELYIRTYCNATEQSVWVGPINFNTLCDPQPTPYYESLDDADPNTKKFCWSINNQNNDNTQWFINENDASISQAPSFFTPFGGFDDWLITGPVNVIGLKRLRFNYRVVPGIFAPSPRGNLEVLLSTTPDFATYTTLIPSHDFTHTVYQEDSVLFTGAGTVYIAFRVPPTMTDPANSGVIMISDMAIDDAPACSSPSNLNITTVTTSTANLNWVAGYTETEWQIVVQAAGSGIPTGSGTTVNTTPSYNATGLTPDSAYEYYVRAVCSATETSVWVGPFTFRTTCIPLPTPFLETFNSSSTTETCWTIINGGAISYDWDLNESANPIFGNQMAGIFTGTNGNNDDWLITPTLTARAGQRLRFYYKVYSSDYTEDLKIKLSTNGTTVNQFSTLLYQNSLTTATDVSGTVAGSNTITVASTQDIRIGDVLYMPGFPFPYQTTVTNISGSLITMSNAATLTLSGVQHVELTHEIINNEQVREMVIDLTSVTSQTNINIGFNIPSFPPNPWNYRGQFLFIDNVIVEDIPACPSVINVVTSNIVDTTAQINWQSTGAATSWEISVQPFGTPAPIGATLPAYLHTATSHPYTVTGLTSATQYQYYIRSICSGSSQSEWIGPFTFTTRCDFTNVCQYTITVTNGNTGPVTDNVSVMQNGVEVQAIEFPGFGQTSLDYQVFLCSGVEFNLYWNGFGSGIQYYEAQMVVKDEAGTIIWTSPLGLGAVNTNIYTGFASCGVITCPQPTNLAVTNQGVLNWSAGGSETQWEVFVQPLGNGTLPQSGTIVNSPTYTPVAADFVNGSASTYEYFVRAICGPSNTSFWSGPKVFIRNDESTTSVHLPVNSGEDCIASGMDVSFIGATASTIPSTCGGVSGNDVWFDFVAASKIQYIELSDFTPGSYYISSSVGEWPRITMALYEVQPDGSLVEKGCSNNNSMTTMYSTELTVGTTYKIRLKLNNTIPNDKKFHICITTPNDLCNVNAFNYSFEKLQIQDVAGITTILDATVIPGWRVNTDWGTMFFLDSSNLVGGDPYTGGQYVQLLQDDTDQWNPSDPNIKGLYKDMDTSEITKMDYSFASASRTPTGTTVNLFAGPPTGPFTAIAQHTANSTTWQLIQGTYVIPTGQTTTRFIFRVEGNAIGHLLDDANFKANVEININTANTTLDCTTTAMNFDANGVGQWVAADTNPAITTIANPNSGATTVSGFTSSGTYTFNWNTRYCQKSIVITKTGTNDVPTVATPVTYCQGAIAIPLVATAPNSADSLLWYTQPTTGTGSTSAPIPQTTTTGTTSYYVSVVGTGGCEGPRTEIIVQVNALPTATILGTTTICSGSTTGITFNGTANATVTYTVNNGTNQTVTLDATGTAIVTTPILTSNTNYALVSVSSAGTSPCSQSQTGSALITVEILPTAAISGTTSVCEGATAVITFNGTANATVIYTINNGANQTITLDGSGTASITTAPITANTTYSLVSVSSAGTSPCSQSQTGSALITIAQLVLPNLTIEQFCQNSMLTLRVLEDSVDISSATYSWTQGNTTVGTEATFNVDTYLNQNTSLSLPLTFTVTIGLDGCSTQKEYTVTNNSCRIIPKGISPNDDGLNDTLDLTGYGVKEILIFNRYGTKVYSFSGNYTNEWKGQTDGGKELPDGTYFYTIQTTDGANKTGWIYINRQY